MAEQKMQDNTGRQDEELTGTDIPGGDGTISDEAMDAISGGGKHQKTGQDHSTEHHEDQMPTEGVGAIQSSSDTTSDVAHIEDESRK